jgi:hypothetical protein
MIYTILIASVAIYFGYKWLTATYDYFEKRGIVFRQPKLVFGTNENMFYTKKNIMDVIDMWYYEFKNAR